MTFPHGWTSRRFDQLGELCSGSTPSSSRTEFWDGATVWVTPTDLSRLNTPYLQDSAKHITERGLRNCSARLLPPGCIVLSSRAPIGYVAISTVPFCTNQGCKSIALHNSYHSEFVYYAVTAAVPRLKRLGEGTTFAEISKSSLAKAEVILPIDKAEQAKIAEVLSTVDRAIEETEALIAKQQRIETGLMQDLLTRGIDEHGNLRSEQTHEFKDSALGRIPAEWDVAGLSTRKHAKKPYLKTGPFGSSLKISDWVEHGIPVITIGALGEGSFEESDLLHISMAKAEQLAAYALEPGDIVFSRVADVGRSVVVTERERDWIMSSNMMRISIDVAKADPNFLRLNIVKHPGVRAQIRQTVNASGREVANQQVLDALRFPWPSVDEQRWIVRTLARQSEQIVCKEACLYKFRRAKAGLMKDLLTGNRRVTALLEQREEVTT